MPLSSTGTPIDSGTAQLYMNKYISGKKTLKDKVLNRITLGEINSDSELKDCVTTFYAEENAFFFSRDMIDRFFNPPNLGDPIANYLVIILGTKFSGSDIGQPTVVIAGVNEHPTRANTFVSLNMAAPAVEQPPRQTLPTFPVPDSISGFANIEFTIL